MRQRMCVSAQAIVCAACGHFGGSECDIVNAKQDNNNKRTTENCLTRVTSTSSATATATETVTETETELESAATAAGQQPLETLLAPGQPADLYVCVCECVRDGIWRL